MSPTHTRSRKPYGKKRSTGEKSSLSPPARRASQVLREALAKGADRAIHLEDNAFVGLDALNTARAFAAAIKDEKFDLIFTGLFMLVCVPLPVCQIRRGK